MVRAILDGRKTQTRRVIIPQPWLIDPSEREYFQWECSTGKNSFYIKCPYGIPGDLLWVRETWCEFNENIKYRADGKIGDAAYRGIDLPGGITYYGKWKSSRFMPKKYARLWLEVISVRVERVQNISAEEAIAEGMIAEGWTTPPTGSIGLPDKIKTVRFPIGQFAGYWDSLNAKRVRHPIDKNIKEGMSRGDSYGWVQNPWVWVIEFKRVDHDQ